MLILLILTKNYKVFLVQKLLFIQIQLKSGCAEIAGISLCAHLQHLLRAVVWSLRVTTPKEK